MRWTLFLLLACGSGEDDRDGNGDGNGTIEGVYRACDAAEDCDVESQDPVCLDKASEGYCTWECAEDVDCADSGAEADGYDLVCASFENEGAQYCFPSCEDPPDTGGDGCPTGFGCRSTGGGASNRKVCFPSDPATTTP